MPLVNLRVLSVCVFITLSCTGRNAGLDVVKSSLPKFYSVFISSLENAFNCTLFHGRSIMSRAKSDYMKTI